MPIKANDFGQNFTEAVASVASTVAIRPCHKSAYTGS